MDAPRTPAITHVSEAERSAFVRMVAAIALEAALRQVAAEDDSHPSDPSIEDHAEAVMVRQKTG